MDERTVQAGDRSPASPDSAKPEPDHVFGPRPRLRLADRLAGEVVQGDGLEMTEADLDALNRLPVTEPGDEGSGCPAHTDPADSEDLEDQAALGGQPFAVTVTTSGQYAWRCARPRCLAGGEDGIALATRSAWAHAETAHGLTEPTSTSTRTPTLDALLAEHGPDGAGACRGCGWVFDPDDVSAWCPTVLAKMWDPTGWAAELLASAGDYRSVTVTADPTVNALDRLEVAAETLAAQLNGRLSVVTAGLDRVEDAVGQLADDVRTVLCPTASWARAGREVFRSAVGAVGLIWVWLVFAPVVQLGGLVPLGVFVAALTLCAHRVFDAAAAARTLVAVLLADRVAEWKARRTWVPRRGGALAGDGSASSRLAVL